MEHRGPDAVGAQGAHVDVPVPLLSQIRKHAEAKRDGGVLGGGVERLPRRRDEAGERADVDDVTAPGLAHRLARREGAVDRAEGVHLEEEPPVLGGLTPRGARAEEPRVVHPDGQLTLATCLSGEGGAGVAFASLVRATAIEVEPRIALLTERSQLAATMMFVGGVNELMIDWIEGAIDCGRDELVDEMTRVGLALLRGLSRER